MTESGKNDFIGKKSYEIAYALWRIGTHTEERIFADKLFDKAIELVGCAADSDYGGMRKIIGGLEMIIKFAVDVNCISVPNAAILAREVGNLKAAIEEVKPGSDFADIDIADIFSIEEKPEEKLLDDFLEDIRGNGNIAESNGESGKKAEMRQAAILEKIRQTGDCRLADIQEILPYVSERTLRYDIEALVQQNLIERLGTGGRSVYYRIRPVVNEA